MKVIEHIGTGNLFHQLTDEELKLFRRQFKKVLFKAGAYIFKENDMGDTLYIVAKGVVLITRRIMVDVEKNIFVANEGTVFGEFSFMDAGERSASALVEQDAELLSLKRSDFDKFANKYPIIGTKLYNNLMFILVERLRRTNDAYRDAVRWNLELTGSLKLNFQYLINEDVDISIELNSGRVLEGKVIQLEKSEAGHEIILLDRDNKLNLIPYHAAALISLTK
ncbi:MAG: cyclic nucleotide-binding domain-containing protein [Desulfobacterales bacterium]|nr:cyclic nucleotide-binding domain-containing protein [Desulfobacterales bacterium]